LTRKALSKIKGRVRHVAIILPLILLSGSALADGHGIEAGFYIKIKDKEYPCHHEQNGSANSTNIVSGIFYCYNSPVDDPWLVLKGQLDNGEVAHCIIDHETYLEHHERQCIADAETLNENAPFTSKNEP